MTELQLKTYYEEFILEHVTHTAVTILPANHMRMPMCGHPTFPYGYACLSKQEALLKVANFSRGFSSVQLRESENQLEFS